MRKPKKKSLLAASLALLGASGTLMAQSPPAHYGYWVDSSHRIVKNSWGECWRSGYWTPALAVAECEGGVAEMPVPKAVPVAPPPVAAPAPALAPAAVAPPPPPPPMAAPAPAPAPADVFRTQIIEKPVRLEGANFATGSSRLLAGAGGKLDEVVSAAQQYPEIDLTVTGYTDSTGSAQVNERLSKARADAVKAYLVGKGVAASRITTSGRGAAEPIADNATADGRAQNRRVEIRYVLKEETRVRVTR